MSTLMKWLIIVSVFMKIYYVSNTWRRPIWVKTCKHYNYNNNLLCRQTVNPMDFTYTMLLLLVCRAQISILIISKTLLNIISCWNLLKVLGYGCDSYWECTRSWLVIVLWWFDVPDSKNLWGHSNTSIT